MASPYSDDLRARIGAAVRDGCTVREAADLYDVSAATAARCGKRLRECGSAAAKAMGGARRDVLADHKDGSPALCVDCDGMASLVGVSGPGAHRTGHEQALSHARLPR